jgi:hypothetical protein
VNSPGDDQREPYTIRWTLRTSSGSDSGQRLLLNTTALLHFDPVVARRARDALPLDHLHDHLPLRMPLLEVGESVGDVSKGKHTVNHDRKLLLVDERRQC